MRFGDGRFGPVGNELERWPRIPKLGQIAEHARRSKSRPACALGCRFRGWGHSWRHLARAWVLVTKEFLKVFVINPPDLLVRKADSPATPYNTKQLSSTNH